MDDKQTKTTTFTRREMLLGTGAVLASAGIPSAFASSDEHKHGDHGKKHNDLIESTLHCIRDGEACLDHCMELFKMGDTSVAKCADTVTEMIAMCTSMHKLVSYNSRHAAALASVCIKVCEDCEKECDKHADKHAACRDCARSCKDCIRACKKIAA